MLVLLSLFADVAIAAGVGVSALYDGNHHTSLIIQHEKVLPAMSGPSQLFPNGPVLCRSSVAEVGTDSGISIKIPRTLCEFNFDPDRVNF
jgi:hypothetical protein